MATNVLNPTRPEAGRRGGFAGRFLAHCSLSTTKQFGVSLANQWAVQSPRIIHRSRLRPENAVSILTERTRVTSVTGVVLRRDADAHDYSDSVTPNAPPRGRRPKPSPTAAIPRLEKGSIANASEEPKIDRFLQLRQLPAIFHPIEGESTTTATSRSE